MIEPPSPIVKSKSVQEEMYPIQGTMPDSINEFYVATEAEKLGLDFSFQYVINGGTLIRGGQTIDFVFWSATGGQPVEVQGAYWHNERNDPERPIKLAEEERIFHKAPIELSEDETNTRSKARQALIQKVM